VIKDHIQPYLDKGFVVSTTIEKNMAHMQAIYEPGQAIETDTDTLVPWVE